MALDAVALQPCHARSIITRCAPLNIVTSGLDFIFGRVQQPSSRFGELSLCLPVPRGSGVWQGDE